jgi:hypothetical protein
VGTPKNFGQFARALRELAKVPSAIAAPVAHALTARMRRDFRSGQDAYGRAYAPLAPASLARGRTPPPLRKYARFANVTPLPSVGVAMLVTHPQAGFHQTGTTHMPKRIVVPDGVVPAEWRRIIDREFKRAVKAKVAA